jgi:O-antigen/teichoic acid export membrane protein
MEASAPIEHPESLGSMMAKGAAWTTTFRIIDRCTGVISTSILARLLVPEDFGLVALAASIIAMLEILGAFGLEAALVQHAAASRRHFDAVWTFNVAFGLSLGLVVAGLAWPVAVTYEDPRFYSVLIVLGLRQAIQGFENVGIVAFRKDLAFEKEFRFLVIKRLATTFLVTLPLAFLLRNYWALLGGSLAATCIGVVLSYVLHPFRPRISLAGLSELMAFSKWLLLTHFVEFLYSKAANFVIGAWAGTSAIGSLSVAREVASIASRELAASVNRAAFPGYAKLAGDRAMLREKYLKLVSILMLIIMPAGMGLCLLAEPIVLVVLGNQWIETVPLIRILAINGVFTVFLSTAHHVNLAVGMSRSSSLVLAVHAGISITLMLWLVPASGSHGAVLAMITASIATAPLNAILLGRAIQFGIREIIDIISCPLMGSLLMTVVVLSIRSYWGIPPTVAGRIAYIAAVSGLGAVVYFLSVFLHWQRRSNPNAAEAWIWEQATKILYVAS